MVINKEYVDATITSHSIEHLFNYEIIQKLTYNRVGQDFQRISLYRKYPSYIFRYQDLISIPKIYTIVPKINNEIATLFSERNPFNHYTFDILEIDQYKISCQPSIRSVTSDIFLNSLLKENDKFDYNRFEKRIGKIRNENFNIGIIIDNNRLPYIKFMGNKFEFIKQSYMCYDPLFLLFQDRSDIERLINSNSYESIYSLMNFYWSWADKFKEIK